jgi:ferrous iron transport protein B
LLIGAFLTEGYAWWVPGVAFFSMYMLGLILAPLVAFCLKSTVLRGETPPFVMEMPLYKAPSIKAVIRRSLEAGWMFLRRAGTVILASMIVVWALLYFPTTSPDGESYPDRIAALEELDDKPEEEINELNRAWKARSILGRVGKAIEPAVEPLGWDWRIGMAALASFPAREVIVGVLGIIFGEGDVDPGEASAVHRLGERLREVEDDRGEGRKIFTLPVALSLMVFFALCAQCASTLAVIRRETRSWAWPTFAFVYMTALAYVGALVTYQLGRFLV